ncbi:glycosyltransferase family 25 protein [Hafnia paralvei]|uniref:glycosyltransferase family 25 protein n=1 Tax=Hafnia paralvei TaxID=546367 RepID=UPI00300D5D23
MKAFAVNLKREPLKKDHILTECKRHELDVEIIDAVEGTSLSELELKELVYDYPNCYLTKGEIGCVLSHASIYKKMIAEGLDYALILEDDAIINSNSINTILGEIPSIDDGKANVWLLSDVEAYVENKKSITKSGYVFHKAERAYCTHGYILNRKAAKKMISISTPIKFEADRWQNFYQNYWLNVYCLVPHIISTNDIDKSHSTIETDRKSLELKRRKYRNKIKKRSLRYWIYRNIRKFFVIKNEIVIEK